jgi:hypothetical protein
MNPVTLIVLICSASIPSQDCQLDNALDVIRGPNIANETTCGMRGRTIIAATEMRPRFGGEYVKVLCPRSDLANGATQVNEQASAVREDR